MPMEKLSEDGAKGLWRLFTPLFHVEPYRHLPISLLYKPQGKLTDEESTEEVGILVEEIKDDVEKEHNEKINRIYLKILLNIVEESGKRDGSIEFKILCEELKKDEETFRALTHENLLFITILKLYEMETLDVCAWRESEKAFLGNITGEFNVDTLLYQLLNTGTIFDQVDKIIFTKIANDSFEVVLEEKKESILYRTKVELDNISIKVVNRNGKY